MSRYKWLLEPPDNENRCKPEPDAAKLVNRATNTFEWGNDLTTMEIVALKQELGALSANEQLYNTVYKGIKHGKSIRDIAKAHRGKKGFSLRNIAAVSSALTKIFRWDRKSGAIQKTASPK